MGYQDLSGVPETLLILLCYRAIETQRPDALIKDEKAVELVKQLSSDGPIRYDSGWITQTPMAEANKVMRIILTREMDRYSRDFLKRHPEAVVVHIGCGLDSRFDRVVERNSQVEWYDLDLPDVIKLLRKLIGDEEGRYHLLGCSVLEPVWLEVVKVHRGYPFLFLAEGVFMHLEQMQVKPLVRMLHENFQGSELAFDCYSPIHVLRSNLQTARFGFCTHWGIWHDQELEKWAKGIRLLDEWGFLDESEPRLAPIRWLRPIESLFRTLRIYHFQLGEVGA
jgi:O-methyltransferase involved in polyketide biosynthesis